MQYLEDMPTWKKVLVVVFIILMPFIGSIHSIAF